MGVFDTEGDFVGFVEGWSEVDEGLVEGSTDGAPLLVNEGCVDAFTEGNGDGLLEGIADGPTGTEKSTGEAIGGDAGPRGILKSTGAGGNGDIGKFLVTIVQLS